MKTAPSRLADLHALASAWSTDELLRALVNDENDIVRHEAAFLLGDIKRQGRIWISKDAAVLEALCNSAMKDKSVLVRHEAALSLAKWPGATAIEVLTTLCCDDMSPEVVSSARYALQEMLLLKDQDGRPVPVP